MIGSLMWDNVGSMIQESTTMEVSDYFDDEEEEEEYEEEPRGRGRPMTVGKTTKRKLMYVGNRGDQGTPFVYKGVSFEPRTVYPVTPSVFDVFRAFHNFVVVEKINRNVLHFPGSWI